MGDSVAIRDGRRPPFLWCSLAAMERLREICTDGRELMSARSLYVAMCELAARGKDGQHHGFVATMAEIAGFAGISERRLTPHLARVVRAGLIEVEERRDLTGRSLPNVYRLTEPDAEADRGDVSSSPPKTKRPGAPRRGDATASPPSHARPDAVELKKEEGEREERASAQDPGVQNGEHEAALRELAELLKDRGEQLPDRSAAAIRTACRSSAAGVDVVAAARRLRRAYGPDGRAAQRRIADIGALFATELAQSSPESAGGPARRETRPHRNRHHRRRAAKPSTTRTPSLRIHQELPAGIEKPGARLGKQWARIRQQLRASVQESTWMIWLNDIELAGSLTMLVDEAGGDEGTPTQVLIIAAPSETIGWVSGRFGRLITSSVREHLGDRFDIELVLAPTASNARRAA